jgi:hypothetical protein
MSNAKIRKLKEEVKLQQYKWASGRSFGVSADVAGEELARLQVELGAIRSRDVVDAARPDDAPLHPAFEWNDWKAAENYRRHQASTLIRALVVLPIAEVPQSVEHRAYYHTVKEMAPAGSAPVYVPAVEVVNSPSMLADAARRLSAELEQARRSIEELERLAEQMSAEPERMARIALAMRAIETAGAAVAALH